MTSLDVPLSGGTYSQLLENYLASRQFQPAFEILCRMQPSTVACTRFLHACCEGKELVQADNAWMLMKEKGVIPTSVAYNLMIRCHGRCGDVNGALQILEEMRELGLELTEDTLFGLLDAHIQVCALEGCVKIFREIVEAGFVLNLHRLRKLIHVLCIDRRVDDAFEVFELAVRCEVDGDLKVCSDLIDLAKECSCPERVPPVFLCMVRKSVRLDIARAHVLISQLSQVDKLSEAMTVLNWLPFSAQRANAETYMQLIGTCLRAGLGDEGMRTIREFSQIAPSDKRPSLYFYNFCLRGYRALKSPSNCQAIMELIWKEEQIDPDYESYAELIGANLEARRFKPALISLSQMTKAGFQAQAGLSNVYVVCLASSKTLQHHDLAWAMYSSQLAQGGRIDPQTHTAMFDSCVSHARITRTLEVGLNMEAAHMMMGPKRHEHLKRARSIVQVVGAQDLRRPPPAGARAAKQASRPDSPASSSPGSPSRPFSPVSDSHRLPKLRHLPSDVSIASSAASSPKHPSKAPSPSRPGSRASSDSRGHGTATALSQASTHRSRSSSRASSRASVKPSKRGLSTPSPLPPLPSADDGGALLAPYVAAKQQASDTADAAQPDPAALRAQAQAPSPSGPAERSSSFLGAAQHSDSESEAGGAGEHEAASAVAADGAAEEAAQLDADAPVRAPSARAGEEAQSAAGGAHAAPESSDSGGLASAASSPPHDAAEGKDKALRAGRRSSLRRVGSQMRVTFVERPPSEGSQIKRSENEDDAGV